MRTSGLLSILVLIPAIACGEVRVYRDLEQFQAETLATIITAPYPSVNIGNQLSSLVSGEVEFFRAEGGLFPAEWTTAFPGNDLAISGIENFDIRFSGPHHHAVGFVMIDESCANCIDSVFTIRVIGHDSGTTPGTPTLLHEEIFHPEEDVVSFIGFASDLRIVRLEIRETVGHEDNEYFGPVYGRRDRPESIPPGQTPVVLEMNQSLDFPLNFKHSFDFDMSPAGGGYLGVALDSIELMATGGTPWIVETNSPLGGRAARQPDTQETWTVSLPAGSHAVDFRLWESSQPGSGTSSCYEPFCFDTLYRVEAFNGAQRIWSSDYSPWNDLNNRLALWSSVPIDRLEIRAVLNNTDDELLGDIRTSDMPLPSGYPRRIASSEAGTLGRWATVHGTRAVISRQDDFELWRLVGGQWEFSGERSLGVDFEALDFDGQHLLIAGQLNDGTRRLHIFQATGNDPALWPSSEFDYPDAATAVAVDGDLAALGLDDRVAVFRRIGGVWQADGLLEPDPPVSGISAFGRGLGIDGDLLVVGAEQDVFHLFRDNNGTLTEIYRRDQATNPGTQYVDVTGQQVVQQTFDGSLLLFAPDGSGVWGLRRVLSQPLPFGSSSLGNGVRMTGDYIVALQSFSTPDVVDFRQAINVWKRRHDTNYVRYFLMPDPHLSGTIGSLFGNFGDALATDGEWLIAGHPSSPWCRGVQRDFFGDSGSQNYRGVCEGRSGAAFIARLEDLGVIFRDRFMTPHNP